MNLYQKAKTFTYSVAQFRVEAFAEPARRRHMFSTFGISNKAPLRKSDSTMNHTQQSCTAFIQALASKEPTPGGGGASALVGAIGVALGNMVGSLTLGKKKYTDVQEDIIALKAKADALTEELLELVVKDAEVFFPLSQAYGMPSSTDAEKTEKALVMQNALRQAVFVPIKIMRACCNAIDLHKEFAKKGTTIAISDVGCGVACCKAALLAASLNVFINTKSMTDRACADEQNSQADAMLSKYTALADEIFADVNKHFRDIDG
jgi:formiminotetrahydrofolate cyclodeaminase